MICAATSFAGHTINLTVEDCQASNRFIAPNSTTNRFLFAGTMRNCQWSNTATC